MMMKWQASWFIALLLTGCSVIQGTPRPAPPPGPVPQEIRRDQTSGLIKAGHITVIERGSPQDAERAILARATAAGVNYYQILFIEQTLYSGQWHAEAILYRQADR
ncbi:biofilm stress and motility protein A [Salmonella enterica subsp. enterica serovar Choleraesuis]|nr:biofilm stress and motility protein A [Salmonella enterica subsp. enterica serovar Choleraesuis]